MKRNFAGQFRLSAIPDDRYSLCISADRRTAEPSLPSTSADRYSQSFQPPLAAARVSRPLEFEPRVLLIASFPLIVYFFLFSIVRKREARIKRKIFIFLFVNYLDPFLCRLDRWFKVSNFRSIPLFLIYLIRLIRLIDIFIFYATVFNNSFASWYIRRSESSGWMC